MYKTWLMSAIDIPSGRYSLCRRQADTLWEAKGTPRQKLKGGESPYFKISRDLRALCQEPREKIYILLYHKIIFSKLFRYQVVCTYKWGTNTRIRLSSPQGAQRITLLILGTIFLIMQSKISFS